MKKDLDKMFEPYSAMMDFSSRIAKGAEAISRLDMKDVAVGATPKTQIFASDKVTVHHYEALDKNTEVKTDPVLIAIPFLFLLVRVGMYRLNL